MDVHVRNFGGDALANRLMGTRFDVEVTRHFHADIFDASWLGRRQKSSRAFSTLDGVDALAAIVDAVERGATREEEREIVSELSMKLRATESVVRESGAAISRNATHASHQPWQAAHRAAGKTSPRRFKLRAPTHSQFPIEDAMNDAPKIRRLQIMAGGFCRRPRVSHSKCVVGGAWSNRPRTCNVFSRRVRRRPHRRARRRTRKRRR